MFNQSLYPYNEQNAFPVIADQLHDEDRLGRVGDEESIPVQRPQTSVTVDEHGSPPTVVSLQHAESSRIIWVGVDGMSVLNNVNSGISGDPGVETIIRNSSGKKTSVCASTNVLPSAGGRLSTQGGDVNKT